MTGIEIRQLSREQYAGHEFTVEYVTDRFYDVELLDGGFRLKLTECEPMKKGFTDELFSHWLEEPVVYGAFRDGELLAFVEGSRESWHNVFRISNVFVEKKARRQGVGETLMRYVIGEIRAKNEYRAIELETQTCNFPAISLYRKLGFSLCRIDIAEYSNSDIENREVRIDLIMKL